MPPVDIGVCDEFCHCRACMKEAQEKAKRAQGNTATEVPYGFGPDDDEFAPAAHKE